MEYDLHLLLQKHKAHYRDINHNERASALPWATVAAP